MKTAKYVKNITTFIACFAVSFILSMYGMPLSNLTLSIVDWSYSKFNNHLSGVYESDSDPLTFMAMLAVLLIYSLIIFLIFRAVMRIYKK